MKPELKIENSDQLLELLNGMVPAIRSTALIDGMIAGANYINRAASQKLNANKQAASLTGYSYYQSAFKTEKLKGKTPDEIGVRTGVWDRKNGYKLRWLEWGTAERKTYKRKNALTGKIGEPANRGRIVGNNFFFGSVRSSQDEVFRIISDAVIKSLENLTAKNA